MGQLDYLRFKLYKTHRCKKSLFNGMSVRLLGERYYTIPGFTYKEPQWTIGGIEYDSETTTPHWNILYRGIEFCPYCGDKLIE